MIDQETVDSLLEFGAKARGLRYVDKSDKYRRGYNDGVNKVLHRLSVWIGENGPDEDADGTPEKAPLEDRHEFPVDDPNCRGCGKPLTVENAWMVDGCPCNSVLGVNVMNATRWRLLGTLQQNRALELEKANAKIAELEAKAEESIDLEERWTTTEAAEPKRSQRAAAIMGDDWVLKGAAGNVIDAANRAAFFYTPTPPKTTWRKMAGGDVWVLEDENGTAMYVSEPATTKAAPGVDPWAASKANVAAAVKALNESEKRYAPIDYTATDRVGSPDFDTVEYNPPTVDSILELACGLLSPQDRPTRFTIHQTTKSGDAETLTELSVEY